MTEPKVNGALFSSCNLLGDGLYVLPVVRAWQEANPDAHITIATVENYVTPIYRQSGITNNRGVPLAVITVVGDFHREVERLRLIEEKAFDEFTFHDFNVNKAFELCDQKGIHITQAYAALLGVQLSPVPSDHYLSHLRPYFVVKGEPKEKDVILISAHSMSCSSRQGLPPNKMLPWGKWRAVLTYLRSLGHPIRILGAAEDRWPEDMGIKEEEYRTGIPLNEIALLMSTAKLLVTVDNGMSHLAATQRTPTFLMYPSCLGIHYILPWGNENLRAMQMDPAEIDERHIIMNMRRVLPELLSKRR